MRPEPEPGHRPSVYNEIKFSPKVLIPSEVEPSTKPSARGESEGGRRVTISPGAQSASRRTSRAASESPRKSSVLATPEPEYKQYIAKPSDSIYEFPRPTLRPPEPSSRKHSVRVELELTPRPLPPRCLPRYGPDSTWWALLSPDGEMPNSRPTTPDIEPKSPPPPDPSLPFFEMETSPFCEDLMFQREKASPSQAGICQQTQNCEEEGEGTGTSKQSLSVSSPPDPGHGPLSLSPASSPLTVTHGQSTRGHQREFRYQEKPIHLFARMAGCGAPGSCEAFHRRVVAVSETMESDTIII